MNLRQIISLIARVIVGGVLIYSGASKALEPSAEFAATLAAYHLMPPALVASIAQVWPWMELLVGTYVFFGYFTRLFASIASAMFVIFLTVLISAVLRGIDPGSCGCFGAGLALSPRQAMGIDAVLLLLSLVLAYLAKDPTPFSADSWIER
jgi:uncharacterized membrane protein YphA (DoxX/SURF4 family)